MSNSSRNRRFLTSIVIATAILHAVPCQAKSKPEAKPSHSVGVTPCVARWQGFFEHPKWRFKADMRLDATGKKDELKGQIAWTMLKAPAAKFESKIGKTAVEHVTGKYDMRARQLILTGTSIDDPDRVGITLDKYDLALSTDGKTLSGGTAAHSDGLGKFTANRVAEKVKPDSRN